jgi:hypothetical protein
VLRYILDISLLEREDAVILPFCRKNHYPFSNADTKAGVIAAETARKFNKPQGK